MKYATWLCLSLFLVLSSCSTEVPDQKMDKHQEMAYFYLYNQSLISDTFSRMLFKAPIDFRAVDPKKKLLYFVFDKTLNKDDMITRVARDTSLVEFAPCETGLCDFGGLEGNIDGIYAIRTPMNNLNVDTKAYFPLELKTLKDSISFYDVQKLLDTNLYYRGKDFFEINKTAYANLGVLVMKKDKNTSIYKFAQRIKGDLKQEEKIVQKVLDVVANEIEYSYADLWYRTEIFQRAHEVLISGYADCSGKTVLMASLLEQLDIPYKILYYKNHVNIALQGKYPNDNKLNCKINDEKYYLAECTCPNFKIGRTRLIEEVLPDLSYYQDLHKSVDIHSYKTNFKEKLYSREEMQERQGY